MTTMKPGIPLTPTAPPGVLPSEDAAMKAAQRQMMIRLLMEKYPGITPSEAARMLESMEQLKQSAGKEQFQKDMAGIQGRMNPGVGQEAAVYGMDGKLMRGVEQPGAPPVLPPTQPRPQPPRIPLPKSQSTPGMAQPIQPPPQGTPYGQRQKDGPFSEAPGFGAYVGSTTSKFLGNFQDTDGDGIDDRYQVGPGKPRMPIQR